MITGDTVTLTRNEDVTVIDSSHNNFKEVIEKILEDKFEEAFKLMDITKSISKWGKGLLKIEDGIVTYSDMEITSKLVSKIINMMNEGNESFERFAKCLNLTMENPSYKNRSRIMDFVSAGDIEIDDEGYIICYKNVNHDYKDKHTGKFSYKVGETPSMPRHLVDDRDEKTCSEGLHAASAYYLKTGWCTTGKNLRVKVDPRDVVSIPIDYKDSKMRVCKMEVIEDITGQEDKYGF